ISELLDRLCRSDVTGRDMRNLRSLVGSVADEARCYLAQQHQTVIGSVLDRFAGEVDAHANGKAQPVERMLISEMLDIEGDEAVIDGVFPRKQPDWTFDDTYSGQVPAERYADHRRMHP